ncbi:MAG: hypothetical protein HYX71_06000 [Opitutae bacterium]|nr:hypothetical protein [Opitutae bacterium]
MEFLRSQINAHPGEITIIAVGEMTNVAALLVSDPDIGPKIKVIARRAGIHHRPPDPVTISPCHAQALRAVRR